MKIIPIAALLLAVVCFAILLSPMLRQLASHVGIFTASPTMLIVGTGVILILGLWRLAK